MHKYFSQLEKHGNALAIITSAGEEVTYRRLAQLADDFSASFPAEHCLISLEASNEIEAVVAYVASLRSHNTIQILPTGALSTFPALAANYAPDLTYTKEQGEWRLQKSQHCKGGHSIARDVAVLLSTSGTTGDSKMVMLSHKNLESNAESIRDYLAIQSSDRPISALEFSYSYGLSVLNSHLLVGATILLTTESLVDPGFWNFFRERRATCMALVPYGFELLDRLAFEEMSLPHLRYITQAGGRLSERLIRKYEGLGRRAGWKLFVMYGQTEATARIAYMPPELLSEHADCIGLAIPGGELQLIDHNDDQVIGVGESGELVYRGPNVMLGYAQSRLDLARPARPDHLKTGDLAVRNKAGLYRLVGRRSRFVKICGLRINLDNVEQALTAEGHRAVCAGEDECLVVATLDVDAVDQAIAFLHDKYGLRRPNAFVLPLANYPLLPNGKVDYRRILTEGHRIRREWEEEGLAATAPGADVLDSLLKAYRHVTNRSEVRPQDTFVSLGGDSLSYVGMAIQLEKCLGHVPAEWERTSIMELAQLKDVTTASLKRRVTMETDSVLRALAITTVVLHHAGLRVSGGAAFLTLLSGSNLARFNHQGLRDSPVRQVFIPFALRVLVPYYVVVIAYGAYKGNVQIPELLLVSNFVDRSGTFLRPLWFIDSLVQCMLLMAVLLSGSARAKRCLPGSYVMAAVGVLGAMGIHHAFFSSRAGEFVSVTYSLPAILPVFAIGWCAAFAKWRGEQLACSFGLLCVALSSSRQSVFGSWQSAIALAVSGLFLIWVPRLSMREWSARAVAAISTSSLQIYLFHLVPIWFLVHKGRSADLANDDIPLAARLFAALLGVLGGMVLAYMISVLSRELRRSFPRRLTLGLPVSSQVDTSHELGEVELRSAR